MTVCCAWLQICAAHDVAFFHGLTVSAGAVPMGKVRWDARSEDQFIQNYKILQRVFEKRGIDKVCWSHVLMCGPSVTTPLCSMWT